MGLSGKTPIDIFEFFLDDEFINFIVEETNRYARQKGVEFNESLREITTVFGILLVSGYHLLSNHPMYWSVEEDFRIALVAKAMSRDRFDEIIQFLHFSDNQNLDLTNKIRKLCPLMDQLNKKCTMTYFLSQHLDLNEAMTEYFRRHGCKQCIRSKLVGFGF